MTAYAARIRARLGSKSGRKTEAMVTDILAIASDADRQVAELSKAIYDLGAKSNGPHPVTNELRAALAGLALQGLLANPDISARMLANMNPDGESTDAYLLVLTLNAIKVSGKLLEELNR